MIYFYILIYKNLFCAEYQIKTIQTFCKDPYNIILLDSNCGVDEDLSNQLKQLCEKNSVVCITIPSFLENVDGDRGALLLGTKLNYVFYHIVQVHKPSYFAFIDQDMFLYKPFKIMDFLDMHGMWGDIAEVDNNKSPTFEVEDVIDSPWIIHPWLSFFKYDFVKDFSMDWRPCEYEDGKFDTGGRLWETFISKKKIDKKKYWFRQHITMMFPFKEISNAGPPPYETHYFYYNDTKCYGQIQINNEFIHMLNSPSNLLHPKVAYVRGFLERSIHEQERK